MASKKEKHLRRDAPRVRERPVGGGPTGGPAGSGVASGGRLAGFFKRQFLPIFAFSFIALMIAFWLLYRPRLVTVALTVVLLALTLGGVFWLVSLVRKKKSLRTDERGGDTPFINKTHDRRDAPNRPREELESLITQTPPLQAGGSSENPLPKLQNFEDAFRALVKKVNDIDGRLAELEQERYYPPNPKSVEERRPVAGALASPPPRRPAPAYNTNQESRSHPASIDLSSLSQAVCRFLADQIGGWEIERLVQSVQRSMDGSVSIDVEHLVPHSSGEWRLVALWPQRSQEGLVLVSSGELVDDDIAKYFEVSFGRRIIACKQPARVSRSGNEVTVLQKGRVESS